MKQSIHHTVVKREAHLLLFQLRLRRLFSTQGYWCPMNIDLSRSLLIEETSISWIHFLFLDIVAIRYDFLFSPQKIIIDCKEGQSVEYLFALKGVQEYLEIDEIYYARPKIDKSISAAAAEIGIKVLDEGGLEKAEEFLGIKNQDLELIYPNFDSVLEERSSNPLSKKEELRPEYWRDLIDLISRVVKSDLSKKILPFIQEFHINYLNSFSI